MLLETLRSAFAGRLLLDDAEKAPYLTDWRSKWTGRALAVVQPDSAADVAAVVRWCIANDAAVVPQGGNTGMSGAATPDDSGRALVVSLARMNRIRDLDAINNTMTVEAGCVLQSIQEEAERNDRLFPLSLSAEGSCMIGGNLSTNAGGVGVLRFGNARDLCLGLEVVTAEGEIWNGLRGLRKDNSGYDLRDLFIGAEGTLGIITAATLKLFPLPRARLCAWASVANVDDALAILALAQQKIGARLTAFELMSNNCVDLLLEQFPALRWPTSERSAWYVLLEVSDPDGDIEANAALESVLELAFEKSLLSDAAIATNLSQTHEFWALRENMGEAQVKAGKNIKHDISVPISKFPSFIAATNALIESQFSDARMIVFGHLGDGNLHYNVSPKTGATGERFTQIETAINRIVHDAVDACGGSISAEHGLGVLRRNEALRYKSDVEMKLQRAIKHALDPRGIMNPGKGMGTV
ncbi:MAG: FAD-binding oxidoreductase [Betaproteobacteria bacterium]|nr:MAG: FAD-binding oxidoreductase [Betaproteobacteria bacterium]